MTTNAGKAIKCLRRSFKMKLIILLLVWFGLFCPAGYSLGLTLKQAEEFFAQPREFEATASDGKKYSYSAVDIYDFWQKAGIIPEPIRKDSDIYLFDYNQEDEWYLKYPETKLYTEGNLKILRIGSSSGVVTSDYQYLFFRQSNGDWIYFDNIYSPYQKYSAPQIEFLDDSLFYITQFAGSGTGVLRYNYRFFNIKENRINELFSSLKEAYVSGWGMIFDRFIDSDLSYADNKLSLEYSIEVTANYVYLHDYGIEDVEEFRLFNTAKNIAFDYDGFVLELDETKSQLTLDDLDRLFMSGERGFYLTLKSQFDALKESKGLCQEWFERFQQRLEKAEKD